MNDHQSFFFYSTHSSYLCTVFPYKENGMELNQILSQKINVSRFIAASQRYLNIKKRDGFGVFQL